MPENSSFDLSRFRGRLRRDSALEEEARTAARIASHFGDDVFTNEDGDTRVNWCGVTIAC